MSRKIFKCTFISISLAVFLGAFVMAQEELESAGIYTNDEEISIYIKGLKNDIDSVECQIGQKTGQQVSFENVTDMEISARTLIMIDNSLSITQENREKIEEFLKEYIYEKDKEELVAIATFGEKIDTITDYIADRRELEELIEAIEYNDQETYLTDVLYDVIEGGSLGTEDCYKTIIIISDGVDNKSIGYTKEELYSLIKESHYPIYTLGCVYKSNDEQLENMFALSRMTGALHYMLDECEDMRELVDMIVDDSDAVHFMIRPDEALLDGSTKNILLMIESNTEKVNSNIEVRMPLVAEKKVEESITEPILEPESTTEITSEPVLESVSENNNTILIVIFAVAGAVIIAGIIIAVLLFRKRKKQNEFEVLEEAIDLSARGNQEEEDKTVLVGDNRKNNDDGSTQMIWNDYEKQYNLMLTDLKNPGKTFQKPISKKLIIGRKNAEADLVIDYDKSVSGKHCQIREESGKFYVKDLQSSNGTKINDSFVLSEIEIYSGCKLTLGRLEMKVEIR